MYKFDSKRKLHDMFTVVDKDGFSRFKLDNQSNKAELTSSGTSSWGQCPACRFTSVVLG